MSVHNHVSPLLDDYILGNPSGSHFGVCCCPAKKENTDERFIVKMISVPASQTQLDALLLTGAYKDPAQALEYFQKQADDIVSEAEFLQKISKLEGFLPYLGWQIIPLQKNRLGYLVCLLGQYRSSLEKFIQRHPVTHLEAVNIGLDLCAALSAARRSGYLYADLKPGNVFLTENREYRIGDLGFTPLNMLKYTSLPEKYYSPYAAPELCDAMNTINETADTFALGRILYQIYNGGTLPTLPETYREPLPAPAYADEEMAGIIAKACEPLPENRWQDPTEMGQALVTYMQRNAVNDVPIAGDTVQTEDTQSQDQDTWHFAALSPQDDGVAPAGPSGSMFATMTQLNVMSETMRLRLSQEDIAAASGEVPPSTEESAPQPEASPEIPEEPMAVVTQDDEAAAPAEPPELLTESAADPLPELADILPEEPVEEVSESEILTELIEGPEEKDDLYDPVPNLEETIRIPDTPSETEAEEPQEDDLLTAALEDDTWDDTLRDVHALLREEPKAAPSRTGAARTSAAVKTPPPLPRQRNRKARAFFGYLLVLLVLAGAGFGGYWYYQNAYLQTIRSLSADGSRQSLVVTVDTAADNSLLTVKCSGPVASVSAPVIQGKAEFNDLFAADTYRIEVEISGLHKLVGQTSCTTALNAQSEVDVASFTASVGAEAGSIRLNLLTVDSKRDPKEWTVTYAAPGEEPISETFTGSNTILRNLTVGAEYTITLSVADGTVVNGQNTLTYTVPDLIIAKDISVVSRKDGDLTINWSASADAQTQWTVHCKGSNYDETLTVNEMQATFSGTNETEEYLVEVTAAGMPLSGSATVSANPISIGQFTVDDQGGTSFNVSWTFDGNSPQGGWLLIYRLDGSTIPNVVKCQEPNAVINPRIPGASYEFTIQAADATSVYNNVHNHSCNIGAVFTTQGISANAMRSRLLVTPETEGWLASQISEADYRDTFTAGQKMSMVLQASGRFFLESEPIEILFVIRDAAGKVQPSQVGQVKQDWHDMWISDDYHFCELNIPYAPTELGSYRVDMYFNGAPVTSTSFSISE